MAAATPKIEKAGLDREAQALNVAWKDGHESVYPLKHLRAECPCAACKAERDEARRNPFRVLASVPSAELVKIEPVGRYGLKLIWKDGHSTGIYTLDYLREICPCPECAAKRPQDTAPYVHGIYIPE